MKTLKLISALLFMGVISFAKPNPNLKGHDKNVKVQIRDSKPFEKTKVHTRDARNHEKAESRKEARIAKKKSKYNNMRYKHEAKERRNFSEKRNYSKV